MDIVANYEVSVLELRRLLHALLDARPDIGFRCRVMGEMWHTGHMRILKVTERGVALQDEISRKLILIQDLAHIMEFELDTSFQQYKPHVHYSVDAAIVDA